MAVDTEQVRDLVDFSPEEFLVTSFYLNVDAAQFPSPDSLMKGFDSVIHDAEEQRKEIEAGLSHDSTESIRGDLEKIRNYVGEDLDRQDVKGLAIFSCSGQDFWQAFPVPNALDNRVVFGPRPYVGPIASFLSNNRATAVLITDRHHARIFTLKGGEGREWTDFEDSVPQTSSARGWSQSRNQRRSDHWAQHHLDHAAELVLRLQQHYPFDWLILGTEVQSEAELDSKLHPYVKDRVIGSISVSINADSEEVLAKAEELRERAKDELLNRLLNEVQEYAGAGGRGAIGLKPTLQALNEQRVHILLVQDNFQAAGAECPNCGLLMPSQKEKCPACNGETRPTDNVVELAIQRALEQGASVEVATEPGTFEPIESLGAILYY